MSKHLILNVLSSNISKKLNIANDFSNFSNVGAIGSDLKHMRREEINVLGIKHIEEYNALTVFRVF